MFNYFIGQNKQKIIEIYLDLGTKAKTKVTVIAINTGAHRFQSNDKESLPVKSLS